MEESGYENREDNGKIEQCEKKEAEGGMAVGTRRGVVGTTNTIWQVPVSVVGVERAV